MARAKSVHQDDFGFADLFNLGSEKDFNFARINAIVDIHLVAEFQIALRLLGEREDARRTRDFDRADAVRDELLERGWEVRDTPEGPVLVPAE